MTQLPLRDRLALERTVLANRRTFLATLRTGLALLVSGLTFIQVFEPLWLRVIGALFVVLSAPTTAAGWWMYRRASEHLAALDHSGPPT
ncbi:MAG: DUF202 domain-containing protein [Myxococcota bacterium]